MEQAKPCVKCKKLPMVMQSGVILCPRCRISCNALEHWNKFMRVEKRDISQLIEEIERPVFTLNAIAAISDDDGIKRLAAATLTSIKKLDVAPFITDKDELKKVEGELRALVAKIGG